MSLASFQDRFVMGVRYVCRIILLSFCLAGLILVGIDFLSYLFQSSDFTVQQITLEGNERVERDEVLARAGLATGANIWLIHLEGLSQRVERHPAIRSAQIHRVPPHRIHIRVQERLPIAFLLHQADGQLYGVDQEGIILEPLMGPQLPYREAMERKAQEELVLSAPLLGGELPVVIQPGNRIETPRLRQGLNLLRAIQTESSSLYHQLAEVEWADNGNVLLHPKQRIGVILLRNVEAADLAKKLAAFWSSLETHNLRAVYVDARFPDHGFAVRWDEKQGDAWKRAYRQNRVISQAGSSASSQKGN